MHVVQLVPELNQGGLERGVIELNRDLIKRGHKSTVLCSGGDLTPLIEREGGIYIPFNCKSKNLLSFLPRVARLKTLLKTLSPDIVHCSSRIPCWLGFFAARSLKIPFITGAHGFHRKKLYNRVFTWSDKLLVPSWALQEKFFQEYSHCVAPTVIPRGVDLDYFDPTKVDSKILEHLQNTYNLHGKRVFTIIGRLTPWKDQITFLKAISQASHFEPNIVGLCVGRVGKPKYFESLIKLSQLLGIANKVHFFDAHTQIREVYALSEKIVSCSIRPEGFGRTMTESLAMGKPVLATRHGGALDIILEGENGFFFSPKDDLSLSTLLLKKIDCSPDLLRAYVREHFSLEQMVEQTLSLYKSIYKGKSSRIS